MGLQDGAARAREREAEPAKLAEEGEAAVREDDGRRLRLRVRVDRHDVAQAVVLEGAGAAEARSERGDGTRKKLVDLRSRLEAGDGRGDRKIVGAGVLLGSTPTWSETSLPLSSKMMCVP